MDADVKTRTVPSGPWYVRDLTALTMQRLGWTGPSIDSILITDKTGPEIIRDEGDNCVVARIQFEHRPEQLGESNLADAHLLAAAPELYLALDLTREHLILNDMATPRVMEKIEEALAKARGEKCVQGQAGD